MPVLGFGRKRAWEHVQDATRPRIRPVWPSAQRRGVRRCAAVLDRRCAVPGLRCGPRAMSTRAIGRGGTGKTHRAWNWTGKWRSGVGVVLRRQRARRRSEAGRCRGSPGVWILRFDAGWRCEVVPWVRDARDSPAACKKGGGRLTRGGGGSAPTPGARAARLRVLGWRRGGDGVQGVRLRAKKKGARDLGVRDGQGNHGEDHGRDSGGR